MSLKNRLFFGIVINFLITIVIFTIVIVLNYKKTFKIIRIATGKSILNSYKDDIIYASIIENNKLLNNIADNLKHSMIVDYIVIKKNEKLIFSNKKNINSPIVINNTIIAKGFDKKPIPINVILGINMNDMNYYFKRIIFLFICILALMTSIFGFLINLFLSKLFSPLDKLTEGLERLTSENYEKLELTTIKELIPIINSYNYLVDSLNEKDRKIKEQMLEIKNQNKKLSKQLAEIKMLQEQLVTKEKLAGLGTIVAGVAHEINNPAAAIRGICELNLLKFKKDKNLQKVFLKIITHVDKIKEIVRTLKVYGKATEEEKKYFSLKELIDETIEMLKHSNKLKKIKINGNYKKFNKKIFCKKEEIIQIFTNLITNSIEAMNGEGTIKIDIFENSPYIEIHFKDSGPGIPENISDKIFEPFFTTKSKDGTGLGLYIVYKLIEAYGGEIKILPSEKGAYFLIKLRLKEEKNEKSFNC